MRDTTPTPDESIEILKEMIGLWESHGDSVVVPVVDGSPLVGVAIQVQVEHTVRLSEAVVLLAREGHFIQMAPLIRMALECAVSAAWWTISPSNLKASIEEAARLKGLLMEDLGGLAGQPGSRHPDWDNLGAEFAEFRAAEARNFEQRCNALAGGASLYPYCRLLSEASHGGVAIIDEYMTEVPKTAAKPYGLAFLRHAPYKYRDGSLALLVMVLGLALRAWDEFDPEHPDEAAINSFAERIGGVIVVSAAEPHGATMDKGRSES